MLQLLCPKHPGLASHPSDSNHRKCDDSDAPQDAVISSEWNQPELTALLQMTHVSKAQHLMYAH